MFLNNKYRSWYNNIVEKAGGRDASGFIHLEKHHIIPKSLGGTNDKYNIVSLTPREHFICHILLTKFTTGKEKRKMWFAVSSFLRSNKHQKRILSSRQYQIARENVKKAFYSSLASREFKSGSDHPMYGKRHSIESKNKIKLSKQTGIWFTPWGSYNCVHDAIKFAKFNDIRPRLNDNDTLKMYCINNKKIINGRRSVKDWLDKTPEQLGFYYEELNG